MLCTLRYHCMVNKDFQRCVWCICRVKCCVIRTSALQGWRRLVNAYWVKICMVYLHDKMLCDPYLDASHVSFFHTMGRYTNIRTFTVTFRTRLRKVRTTCLLEGRPWRSGTRRRRRTERWRTWRRRGWPSDQTRPPGETWRRQDQDSRPSKCRVDNRRSRPWMPCTGRTVTWNMWTRLKCWTAE